MKKLALGLGTIVAAAAPIATVVACGSSNGGPGATPGKGHESQDIVTANNTTTVDRNMNGAWTAGVSYKVRLGNGSDINAGATKTVDKYSTELFDYYVTPGLKAWKGQSLDHATFEKLVAKFEENVNIGMGAWFRLKPLANGSGVFVQEKPSIEFLPGTTGISWGSPQGSEITIKTMPATPDKDDASNESWFINGTSALMLHEFGHHDTMTTNQILNGGNIAGFRSFAADIQNNVDPKLVQYWNGKGTAGKGGSDWGKAAQDIVTPLGTLKAGHTIFAKPDYNWNHDEFVTRTQMILESVYDKSVFEKSGTNVGDADLGGMYEAFGTSPFEADKIDNFILDMAADVWGIGYAPRNFTNAGDPHVLGVSINPQTYIKEVQLKVSVADKGNASRVGLNNTIKPALKKVYTGKDTEIDALRLGSDLVKFITDNPIDMRIPASSKPVEYRANTDFTNNKVERTFGGKMFYIPDSETRAIAVSELLTQLAAYKSYIQTSGSQKLINNSGAELTYPEF